MQIIELAKTLGATQRQVVHDASLLDQRKQYSYFSCFISDMFTVCLTLSAYISLLSPKYRDVKEEYFLLLSIRKDSKFCGSLNAYPLPLQWP